MADRELIRDNLLQFLRDRLGPAESLADDSDLIDSGIIDSLMLTDLVLYVQAEYALELRSEEVTPANFRSAGALADLIARRRALNGSKAA
jgi:acyl carrier protein